MYIVYSLYWAVTCYDGLLCLDTADDNRAIITVDENTPLRSVNAEPEVRDPTDESTDSQAAAASNVVS